MVGACITVEEVGVANDKYKPLQIVLTFHPLLLKLATVNDSGSVVVCEMNV